MREGVGKKVDGCVLTYFVLGRGLNIGLSFCDSLPCVLLTLV
jgi:hypothetical protein